MQRTKLAKKRNLVKKEESFLQKIRKKFLNHKTYFFSGTLIIALFVYSFSLFRQWQTFDERLIYNETIFPIPTRFDEIPEIIKNFVLGYHIESTNNFFTSHLTIRSNPLAGALLVIASSFLKKSALLYHIFQLAIHLINTALVWLILWKITGLFLSDTNSKLKNLLVSLFTLIWSLHSINVEANLLVTNWINLLVYMLCFLFMYSEITKVSNKDYKVSKFRFTSIAMLFCVTTLLGEYAFSLPLILFFVTFAFLFKEFKKIKEATQVALKFALPYFVGAFLYVLLSFAKGDSSFANSLGTQSSELKAQSSALYIFIERNLWLVPQIFFRFLALLFFPKTLSVYQSNLTPLSNTLFEPYSIFCTVFYLTFLVAPLVLFIVFRRKGYAFILPLVYAFFFSLLPYLHIFLPTYSLVADRYCYFPSFLLILLIACPFFFFQNFLKQKTIKQTITFLSCVLLVLTVRTLIRIQEWNSSYSLYKSAISIEKNLLYKGQKLIILADFLKAKGKQREMEENLKKSLKELNKAKKELKALRKKYKHEPVTLKIYGLDLDSLILKSAYAIALIRSDYYKEKAKDVLAFYEPYIKNKLHLASTSALALYADLLLKDGQSEETKNILEYGLKKYPYCAALLYSLTNYHIEIDKDLEKADKVLQIAYKYFPNQLDILNTMLRFYELKNDKTNEAKFAYLIGLRGHYGESYQRAVQIYLDLNQLKLGEYALRKLVRLKSNDPVTLLLTSRYLDLTGKRGKILELLNTAYLLSKAQGEKEDTKVTKSILASLINVNAHLGDYNTSRKYLKEFEEIKNLNQDDRKLIRDIRIKLSSLQ